jgi:hypothetical protein
MENTKLLKEKYIGIEFGSYKITEYLGRLKLGEQKYERHYFKKVCKFCGSESNSNTPSVINNQIIKKPKCNLCRESINIDKKERKCSSCFNWYPATTDFFRASKNRPFGIHYYCKSCANIKGSAWRSIKENKDKECRYVKERLKIDHIYKFKGNVRTLIKNSFKRGTNQFSKNAKTENILGCTIEEFRIYMYSKFKNGMSFENHGKWHLDHIIPLSKAKTEEEIIKLNHYTNFQPLWAIDNIRKGNKIIEQQLILI